MKRASQILEAREAVETDLQQWKMAEEVTTYSDSDWAGCKDERKSSGADVILLGSHMLKGHTQNQNIICMEQRGVRSVRSSVGSVRVKLENVVVVRSRLRAEISAGNRCRGHRILSSKTRTRSFEIRRCGSLMDT